MAVMILKASTDQHPLEIGLRNGRRLKNSSVEIRLKLLYLYGMSARVVIDTWLKNSFEAKHTQKIKKKGIFHRHLIV